MRKAGLEEAQSGVKISGRNINNLRYADDTTLMVESEDELKSLFRKGKEEKNFAQNSTVRKLRNYSCFQHQMANRWGNNGKSERLYFWGLQIHCIW